LARRNGIISINDLNYLFNALIELERYLHLLLKELKKVMTH